MTDAKMYYNKRRGTALNMSAFYQGMWVYLIAGKKLIENEKTIKFSIRTITKKLLRASEGGSSQVTIPKNAFNGEEDYSVIVIGENDESPLNMKIPFELLLKRRVRATQGNTKILLPKEYYNQKIQVIFYDGIKEGLNIDEIVELTVTEQNEKHAYALIDGRIYGSRTCYILKDNI